MDPNANLKEQLEIASMIQEAFDGGNGVEQEDVERLSLLVITLDEWITKGGFLPAKWSVLRRGEAWDSRGE